MIDTWIMTTSYVCYNVKSGYIKSKVLLSSYSIGGTCQLACACSSIRWCLKSNV